jgi:hypothetical protein
MIVHDDDFFDSIALLALGVMPASEAQPLAKHVGMCADCRLLYASMRASADLVGYQEEAVGERFDEVSRFRLKSRVMKLIRTSDPADRETVAPSRNGSAVNSGRSEIRRTWLGWAIATAAIAIAAIDTISNGALRDENDNLRTVANQQSNAAAVAYQQARELDRRVAEITTPGGKRFPVTGGEIVASDGRIIIALHNLQALPAGKVYQAWTLKPGAAHMTPRATFSPDASGVAFVDVPAALGDVDAVAVSVEPAHGSKAPTTKPTFIRKLG